MWSRHGWKLLLVIVPVVLLLFAFAYQAAMSAFEGQHRTFWQGLEWAAETLTSTGYGADAGWHHPLMIGLVIVAQICGVFLVFLLLPLVFLPLLEARFEIKMPTEAPAIRDHVLVYRYGPAVAGFLDAARQARLPVLVLEEDVDTVRRVMAQGYNVIYGRLGEGLLGASRLEHARAVVANGNDGENAELIIALRQRGFDGDILALVENPFHRKPLSLAGAIAAFTPRHALGAALAAIATPKLSPTAPGILSLGGRLGVQELRVEPASMLAHRTLKDAAIGHRTGAVVLGQWVGGRLNASPTAETPIQPRGILIVAGGEESLRAVEELCQGATAMAREGLYVVAGYGEVGRQVARLLRELDEEVVVVDRKEASGVDVVGDILDPSVLLRGRIQEARCVILAIDSDTGTLLATMVVRDLAPEAKIVARVNEQRNVERIHFAGADFALSLSQVSGQIVTGHLLGEAAITIDDQIKVLEVSAASLADRSLGELDLRSRTGCSVIGVEREGALLTSLGPDFRFDREDAAYICGSAQAIRVFREQLG